jgi:nitrate reductase gamma subunit
LRPSQRLAALAVVLLLAGHLVAVLAPQPLLRLIARPGALYLLEGSGFFLGLLAVLAILPSLFRYLASAGESLAGEIGDGVFLSSVLISLACGLLVAARHRWALAWSLGTVVPYVHSVAAGRPATALVSGTPFAMQLHVVASLAALAVLPFSRLGAALALVILHVMEAGGAAIETAARVLVRWARPQQLAAWLWPAEDLLDLARHQRRQTAAARRVLRARDARAGQAAAPPVVPLLDANLNSGETSAPSVPVEGGQ